MKPKEIALLVDEAIALDADIQVLTERLKEKKQDLTALAESQDASLRTPTDGGGWSISFTGSNEAIARVTVSGDKLKSIIDAEKPAGAKLMQRVSKFRDQLFTHVLKYAPAKNIRERVAELFKPGEAKAIISAVTTEGSVSVSFETKEVAKA